jgi:hypothetical protein
MYNEELHDLYTSRNIIRVMKLRMMIWVGHVARMGEMTNLQKTLVGKTEGQSPLRRSRHRWEDIRMHNKEIGSGFVDWIHLALDRDQWRVLYTG